MPAPTTVDIIARRNRALAALDAAAASPAPEPPAMAPRLFGSSAAPPSRLSRPALDGGPREFSTPRPPVQSDAWLRRLIEESR